MTASSTIFSENELMDWIEDRRSRLARSVRRASAITIRLLRDEGLTSGRLLALSAREVRDPDWRSGFLNRCTIVVREEGAALGRLGLWESGGALCIETRVGGGILVLREATGELWLDEREPSPRLDCSPGELRDLAVGALDSWRGVGTSVRRDDRTGRDVVKFRTVPRRFELRPRSRAVATDWTTCASVNP